MDFIQAARVIQNGGYVRRSSWDFLGFIGHDSLGFFFAAPEGPLTPFSPSVQDVLATDWQVTDVLSSGAPEMAVAG